MTKKNKRDKKKTENKTNFIHKFLSFADNPKTPLIISGLYFLIILIAAFTYHKIGDYGVETDFYEGLVYEAKELLKGNLIVEGFKGPLYPILLAFFGLFTKDFFSVGVLICVISASLFLFFSYRIIQNLFDAKVALLSVLLIASNSVFIQYSYSAGTDLFFCMLVAISLYFLFVKENTLINYFFAGFFASLAFLTRTNGLFLPAAFIIFILIFRKRYNGFKNIIKPIVYYFIGFILLNIPWSIYKFIQKGDFFYDQNFKNTAWALYGEGKYAWDYFNTFEAPKFNSMLDVFLKDPVHFITQIFFVNFYKYFTGDLEKLVSVPFAIILVIGIIALFFRKFETKQLFFFANIFFAFLVLLPAFYSERFSLFLLLGYSTFVSLFLMWEKIYSIGEGKLSLFLFLIVFIWSLFKAFEYNKKKIDEGPKEILEIASLVPDSLKNENYLVIGRKPHIAYELNMRYWKIPFVTSYDSLISWMRYKKADFFFVSAYEAQTLISYTNDRTEQEKFYYLLNPEIKRDELQPIVFTSEPPSVLYKIK